MGLLQAADPAASVVTPACAHDCRKSRSGSEEVRKCFRTSRQRARRRISSGRFASVPPTRANTEPLPSGKRAVAPLRRIASGARRTARKEDRRVTLPRQGYRFVWPVVTYSQGHRGQGVRALPLKARSSKCVRRGSGTRLMSARRLSRAARAGSPVAGHGCVAMDAVGASIDPSRPDGNAAAPVIFGLARTFASTWTESGRDGYGADRRTVDLPRARAIWPTSLAQSVSITA